MADDNALAAWRQGRGYTQRALADLIGRDSKTISAYETGRNPIPDDIGQKLRALGYDGPFTLATKPPKTLVNMSFREVSERTERILAEIEKGEGRPIPPVLRSEMRVLVGEEIEECAKAGAPDRAREKILRWWGLIRDRTSKSQ